MNIHIIIRRVSVIFFLLSISISAHALTPGQVFNKVKDAVVVVKALGVQGEHTGQGSGVFISPNKVATNCHVVKGGASYKVGQGKHLVPATLYAGDGDKDICILTVKGIKGKSLQIGKAANLKVGDPVYAVGAPRGLELSLSDGIVAQLRGGPPPLIQTTAAISPGSSGGGLFDKEGRLVGLTTLYIEGGQSLNFAMPVEWIGAVKPGRKFIAAGITDTEWMKRAVALEQREDWQGMRDWSQKWTESKPEEAFAWFCLGNAYIGLNRHNEAITAFRQTIRIDPQDAGAWNNLGAIYIKLNRDYEAIDATRQAIRIDPENAINWYNLGLAYNRLSRYHETIDAMQQAIRIDPAHALAWNNLAIAYHLTGNQIAALNALRELQRLDPERANKLFNMMVSP